MTDLQFPGGLVRIDESLIWRKLSEWIARTGGDVVVRPAGIGGYSVRLFVDSDDWGAQSFVSLVDAVANSLQAAESGEADATCRREQICDERSDAPYDAANYTE